MTAVQTPPATETPPLAFSAAELARELHISRGALFSLLSAGRILQGARVGRRRLWLRDEVRDWISAGCPSAVRWREIRNR